MPHDPYPKSLAIAGAWGYIGLKFLEAAGRRGIPTFVFDPGRAPEHEAVQHATRIANEDAFYDSPAELFHLAMHPEQRRRALESLLARPDVPTFAILNEKPMAAPEDPDQCTRLIADVRSANALMLFDFPELFDPLTERILNTLRQYRNVKISHIRIQRSKDRENPANPRNYKRIVPIQYQESVHCLAFVLYLLARLRGSLDALFAEGLAAEAQSQPYRPPNPQDYATVVDGRCQYRLTLGSLPVEGLTDFTAGAEGVKRRVIRGTCDGRSFCIEADYQEGRKTLLVDGVDQAVDPDASSYDAVLKTFSSWQRSVPRHELLSGVFPNPTFAHATFQLSSVLWRCCRTKRPIQLASSADLLAFDAGFREALPTFARY
ncbi:MAG: hypothetical protein FJ276_02560 [Planctomycetes bacterium]|nr:hypothetical protein [Planctomycetota bacterium]